MEDSFDFSHLNKHERNILRNKGTERPFTGEYYATKESGKYNCRACGHKLFSSEHKYDSRTGWPSFDRALEGAVDHIEDKSHGMVRTEIVCKNCQSHLGHIFDDGPMTTGKRYCMNSASLKLITEESRP